MKVLFMGTPDFAKTAFERLYDNKFELVGAVTQPDKPKGRGYLLMPPPVKEARCRTVFKYYNHKHSKTKSSKMILKDFPRMLSSLRHMESSFLIMF